MPKVNPLEEGETQYISLVVKKKKKKSAFDTLWT